MTGFTAPPTLVANDPSETLAAEFAVMHKASRVQ